MRKSNNRMAAFRQSGRARKITILEVAEAAGVSIASVSRVVNGLDNVAPPTRKAVLKAIERLNYVPHSGGRALATRRSNLIGVILPDIHGEYFSELVRGIDAAAREKCLHVLVSSAHGDAGEVLSLIREMRGRIDGLVLMSPFLNTDELMSAMPGDLSAVLLNNSGGRQVDSFAIDNFGGARDATRHLIACGRRNIAHIAGPKGNLEAETRRAGYLAAIAEMRGDVQPLILSGDFTDASGFEAGLAISACRSDYDAVFAANDMMALGCLAAFNERGVAVPEDIALVGFDDVPLARFVNPSLTTVGANIASLGRMALRRVVERIEGDETEFADVTIQTRLAVRRSCGSVGPASRDSKPNARG